MTMAAELGSGNDMQQGASTSDALEHDVSLAAIADGEGSEAEAAEAAMSAAVALSAAAEAEREALMLRMQEHPEEFQGPEAIEGHLQAILKAQQQAQDEANAAYDEDQEDEEDQEMVEGDAGSAGQSHKRKRDALRPQTSSSTRGHRKSSLAERTKKITRNRKVNSCLQCRAKKQKCDRQHPTCGNCLAQQHGKNGAIKGQPIYCTYLEAPVAAPMVPEATSAPDALALAAFNQGLEVARSGPSRTVVTTPLPHLVELVREAQLKSRDPSTDFPTRIKSARAASVGWTLFSHVDLALPQPSRATHLMRIYERHVGWYTAIVLP